MDKRIGNLFLGLILLVGIIGIASAGLWDNGLVRYFALNETSGTVAIDSTGTTNGSLVGAPTNISGKIGSAWNFTAVGKYFYSNNGVASTTWTVAGWYNMPIGTIQNVVTSGASELYVRANGTVGGEQSSTFYGNQTITTGTWNFIAMTIDDSTNITALWINNNLAYKTNALNPFAGSNWTLPRTNANVLDIAIDEIGIWNRTLTDSELTQLWNGGAGVTYKSGGGSVNVTSIAPANNNISRVVGFNTEYLINNTNGIHVYNTTLWVFNSAGSVVTTNTTTQGSISTSIAGNISATIASYGNFSWYFQTWYNSSANALTQTNSTTKYFMNSAIIRIISKSGSLIADSVIYVNETYYNTNPIYYPASSLDGNYTMTLQINASSLGGYYTDNITKIFVNLSSAVDYNITLEDYNVSLYFYNTTGSLTNVSGYITDLNQSVVFTNTTYLKQQSTFQNDLIYVRFIKGVYNYATGLTWENKSQFYEYDNSIPYSINENITIFNNIDTSSYFQTQDNAGNIIKGVVIRIYGVVPANATIGTSRYGFFGQRITDDNGRTVFPMDSSMEIYLTVMVEGYQTKTSRLTASEITTFTSADPFIIRMDKSSYTARQNVFLSGLYKLDGTKIYESAFNNLSSSYYVYIYDSYLRDIQYSTSYEGVNHSVALDGTTKSGVMELLSGGQFSSIDNSTWHLYIYVDDELIYDIQMIYNSAPQEVIFNTDAEGMTSDSSWKVVIFIGIIFASMMMGLLFRTGDDDVGLHTFFIGSFLGTLAVTGLGWLGGIAGFYYLGKIIKRLFSE